MTLEDQQKDDNSERSTPTPKAAPGAKGLGVGLAKMAAVFNAYANARYDDDVSIDG